MHCLSPELAYLKHGNTKEKYFQEIVVSGNVAKFTVVLASCHYNDNLGDDNVGVMTTLGFQCNVIPNT